MQIKELQQIVRERTVVVGYFTTPQCNVCHSLRPKIEERLKAYPQIEFVLVDCSVSTEICGQYLVFSVPTVVIFDQGREVQRFSRVFSVDDFEHTVLQVLSGHKSEF